MLDKVDVMAKVITMTTASTLHNLVDLKTQLHRDKDRMGEALTECSESIQLCQATISVLEVRNKQTQGQIDKTGANVEGSAETVEQFVEAEEPIYERILHCSSKFAALEQCMMGVKKGFEKEVISVEDYLEAIRELSKKQFKQLSKMQRLGQHLGIQVGRQQFQAYQQ